METCCENGKNNTCSKAAAKGHLKCLMYAHNNGYSWDENTCLAAAGGGHLDCLMYARKNGCAWNEKTCSKAAAGGHLDCLMYARKNGCAWNETICQIVAIDHLDCLKYLLEMIPSTAWEKKLCEYAAKKGRLDALMYAREKKFHWKNTCLMAAKYGHLSILKYARENGCSWDKWTCEYAAENGHLDCLQFAHKNGCDYELDPRTIHPKCTKYVFENMSGSGSLDNFPLSSSDDESDDVIYIGSRMEEITDIYIGSRMEEIICISDSESEDDELLNMIESLTT